MLRLLLRAAGFLLVAAAFATLVVDGSRTIAGGRLMLYPLGDVLAWLAGSRFAAALAAIGGWPALARDAVTGLLAVPGWIAAAGFGAALFYAGRSRAAGSGFSGRRI